MDSNQVLMLNVTFSLINFALLAKFYAWPYLSRMPRTQAVQILLFFHSFRHIGTMFLASGAVKQELSPAFLPAAWGDLFAAVLALCAILALRLGLSWSIGLVWVFNIAGAGDLLYGMPQGVINNIADDLGAAFWIPAVLVPLLLVTHFLIFLLLVKGKQGQASHPRRRAAHLG